MGPSSDSFWSGELVVYWQMCCKADRIHQGNLKRLFARDAFDYQRHIALDYGPVTKLNGFFEVRTFARIHCLPTHHCEQEPLLYVSDPKALYAMLIKDENIFQESSEFIKCILPLLDGITSIPLSSLIASIGPCSALAFCQPSV